MKYLYIIPARGGSKGIPGKNIRHFAGVPLIARSVAQALAMASAEDVCVTTDAEDIAEAARKAGAEIRFMRPANLATDTASSRDVMLHAIDFYESQGESYDAIVLLQPTSPLRTVDDIRNAIRAFEKACEEGESPDMAVSVCEAEANPYYNAFEADSRGFLHLSKGDGKYTRRQDAPKVWQYNGAVYVIRPESLRCNPMAKFERIIPVEMPSARSVDLDTEADWMLAEHLFRN